MERIEAKRSLADCVFLAESPSGLRNSFSLARLGCAPTTTLLSDYRVKSKLACLEIRLDIVDGDPTATERLRDHSCCV